MNIFAVYGRVMLKKKPTWLEAYQKKYHWEHEWHVTLKQSCFITKQKTPIMIDKLSNFFSCYTVPTHQIQLHFKRLAIDEDDRTIMINANHNPTILKLHTQMIKALKGFSSFVFPHSKKWEQKFQPHLTIVGDLHKSLFKKALRELKHDYACEGTIKEIVLSVVEKRTPSSRTKPLMTKIYSL